MATTKCKTKIFEHFTINAMVVILY